MIEDMDILLSRFLQRLSLPFSRRQTRRRRSICVNSGTVEVLEHRQMLDATGIQAFHRSGQTFITWNEATNVGGEHYNVYRHTAPINSSNLSQAQKLTERWGPVDDQTSVHRLAGEQSPTHFVIQDLGTPLGDDKGLFVYTTPAGQAGSFYYAVTQVTNGIESRVISPSSNATTSAVSESATAPAPILVSSQNNGHGMVYTQFMDYDNWNPTFQGYAYNYAVALPSDYSSAKSYPLKFSLHAYTERYAAPSTSSFDWQAVQVFPDDPGESAGTLHTWWYGFAADHNYQTDGPIPTSGHIENFTEQRLLRTMDEVIARFSVDTTRIHSQGHSMGASGSLSLGIRYGNVFSGIYASEPMTNYKSSPNFQTDYQRLWGTQASNLPVINDGPYATGLVQYNDTGVYDWMNHHEQIARRRGEDMAFLMFGHGISDNTIDWTTQGKPFPQILNDNNIAYTAEDRINWNHTWMGFAFAVHDLFSAGFEDLGSWEFKGNVSYPAFSNANGSAGFPTVSSRTSFYNLNLDWSAPWNAFGDEIIDSDGLYSITLRSRTVAQTADVTLRNLQRFRVTSGATYSWQITNVNSGQVVNSGAVQPDADGVLTIPALQIEALAGSRLTVTRVANAPVITAPTGDQLSLRPVIRWTDVSGAARYRVWITNRSTGASPLIDTNVSVASYTPTADLPLGRYTVWVQPTLSGGGTGPWSAPQNFNVRPATVITTTTTAFSTSTPTISWSTVPGADHFQVWVNNVSTGQSAIVNDSAVTGSSLTLPSLEIGRYRIWVRAFNAQNDYGAWSAPLTFNIASTPTPLSPATSDFTAPTQFQWTSVAGAASYDLFLRNLDTNATVVSQTGITQTTFVPASTLTNANYRWWVRARGSSGAAGAWSVPRDFSVAGRPVLTAPVGQTTNASPTFSWAAYGGAVRYILHVNNLDGAGTVIREDFLTATTFTSPSSLPAGNYRFWVQAVNGTGTFSSWSLPTDFSIV